MIDSPISLPGSANRRLTPDDDITIPDAPTAIIDASGFGRHISNAYWSMRECRRIRALGRIAFVRRNGGGRIAVNVPRSGI